MKANQKAGENAGKRGGPNFDRIRDLVNGKVIDDDDEEDGYNHDIQDI